MRIRSGRNHHVPAAAPVTNWPRCPVRKTLERPLMSLFSLFVKRSPDKRGRKGRGGFFHLSAVCQLSRPM